VIDASQSVKSSHAAARPHRDSALMWFPRLAAAKLPVPNTEFVEFNSDKLFRLDGWDICFDFPFDKLKAACKRIGYPVFLRTDLASAKYCGPELFLVDSPRRLVECVFRILTDISIKRRLSDTRAIMVREYLTIDSMFEAIGGLPIGREWRLFADQRLTKCHHFYWQEGDIRDARTCDGWLTPAGVRKNLLRAQEVDPQEMEALNKIARRAAKSIGYGRWSLDVARDVHGKWWVIDMAADFCPTHGRFMGGNCEH
jgi:hypothetical protein